MAPALNRLVHHHPSAPLAPSSVLQPHSTNRPHPPHPSANMNFSHQQQQQQQQQQQPNTQEQPSSWPGPLPSLHLYPLNDSFVPKLIHLAPTGAHIKIGRQTNAKTVPGERNGYFDSKVLSRTHAEVWEEGGKIYIKDVKSSNGTFVNGERLSAEGHESEPYELKSEDHVEFGIDIVGEDNKTIVHHKVSSKAFCVLHSSDLDASAREMNIYHQAAQRFANMQRRNQPKATGPAFSDITRQLANELAKSRETASELHNLHSAMNEIHDTLGGGNPPPVTNQIHPSYNGNPTDNSPPLSHDQLLALQSQVSDTQHALGENVNRISTLESRLQEQEAIKREVEEMRERMSALQGQLEFVGRRGRDEDDDDEGGYDDEDDTRSVGTVRPRRGRGDGGRRSRGEDQHSDEEEHEREEEEEGLEDGEGDDDDYEDVEEVKEHQVFERQTKKNGMSKVAAASSGDRPSTPEPSLNSPRRPSPLHDEDSPSDHPSSSSDAADSDEEDDDFTLSTLADDLARQQRAQDDLQAQLQSQIAATQSVLAQNQALTSRLDTLGSDLAAALNLSRSLQEQHTLALSNVEALEGKVSELEGRAVGVEGKWEVWRGKMEETWKREREVWEGERERMRGVVREWEEAKRRAEEEDEERKLNAEQEEEEDRWEEGGSISPTTTTMSGGATAARHLLNSNGGEGGSGSRSGTPTPSSSPQKPRTSSLRFLLNPFMTNPSTTTTTSSSTPPKSALSSSSASSSRHPRQKVPSFSSSSTSPHPSPDKTPASFISSTSSFSGSSSSSSSGGGHRKHSGSGSSSSAGMGTIKASGRNAAAAAVMTMRPGLERKISKPPGSTRGEDGEEVGMENVGEEEEEEEDEEGSDREEEEEQAEGETMKRVSSRAAPVSMPRSSSSADQFVGGGAGGIAVNASQIQGAVFVGVVVALAYNYEKVASFVRN